MGRAVVAWLAWLPAGLASVLPACQCTYDGTSGGDELWNSRRRFNGGKGYKWKAKDAVHGGAYRFNGCGAHTRYLDKTWYQIGGYQRKFCFARDGNDCPGAKRDKLPDAQYGKVLAGPRAAWRDCEGDLCEAAACTWGATPPATPIRTLALSSNPDWVACCTACGKEGGCERWDVNITSGACRLFGGATADEWSASRIDDTANQTVCGLRGRDDAPMKCSFRNEYGTCKLGEKYDLTLAAIIIGAIFGSLICLLSLAWVPKLRETYCVASVERIALESHEETRTRSDKHGTHTYTVTCHKAVYRGAFYGTEFEKEVQEEGGTPPRRRDIWCPEEHARVANKAAMIMEDPRLIGAQKIEECSVPFFLCGVLLLCVAAPNLQNDGDRFVANHDPKSIVGGAPAANAVVLVVALVLMMMPFVVCYAKPLQKLVRRNTARVAPHNTIKGEEHLYHMLQAKLTQQEVDYQNIYGNR